MRDSQGACRESCRAAGQRLPQPSDEGWRLLLEELPTAHTEPSSKQHLAFTDLTLALPSQITDTYLLTNREEIYFITATELSLLSAEHHEHGASPSESIFQADKHVVQGLFPRHHMLVSCCSNYQRGRDMQENCQGTLR